MTRASSRERARRTAGLIGVLWVVAALVLAPSSESGPQASTANVKIFMSQGAVGNRCNRVVAVRRIVHRPALLAGTMRALLAGPTAAERGKGYGGWFSARTAGMLRSVRIAGGVAYIDFRDFSRIIPNASTSCGSGLLFAQLDRTATQFATVERAIYSFNGSRSAFYNWLQLEVP